MTDRVALNASRMKTRNHVRVLEELRISPFSRSELSRRVGLTRAAISQIVDSLLQSNILVEGQTISTKSAGRAATELHWNPDAFYMIGVVIRRGYYAVGLYDFCGTCKEVERHNIQPPYISRDYMMEQIYGIIDRMVAEHRPKGKLLGIGVGAPGPLDADAGVIDKPTKLEFLHHAPVVQMLQNRFNCPVSMANDACAHALAELRYGVKDKYDNFLIIEVTGGIGGGLVLDRKLIRGTFGTGNEIGHTTINVFGERCQCGNIGCAELYATIDTLVQRARERDSRLATWKDLVDAANEGSVVATEFLKEEAYYLATLAVNMLNAFDIQAVLLNGRDICYRPGMILGMIREQIPGRLLTKKTRQVDILASTIYEDADAISAANLAVEHFLETFGDSFEPVVPRGKAANT